MLRDDIGIKLAELGIAYEKFCERGMWDRAYECVRNDRNLVKDFRGRITPKIKKDPSRELLDLIKDSYF